MKHTLLFLTITAFSVALLFQQANGDQVCIWTKCEDKDSLEPHCYGGLQEIRSSDNGCTTENTEKYLCCKQTLEEEKNEQPDNDSCVWTECKHTLTYEQKCLEPYVKEVMREGKGCAKSFANYLCCKE